MDERGSRSQLTIRWAGSVFLRVALGISFLSAVADRLGLWGAIGQPNIAWGNFSRFLDDTQKLNWYLPTIVIPSLGVMVTCIEVLLGVLLLIGWKTRTAALLSGILLLTFGISMSVALGIEAPLNFSVFSAAGGALLLADSMSFPFSIDEILQQRQHRQEGLRTSELM